MAFDQLESSFLSRCSIVPVAVTADVYDQKFSCSFSYRLEKMAVNACEIHWPSRDASNPIFIDKSVGEIEIESAIFLSIRRRGLERSINEGE